MSERAGLRALVGERRGSEDGSEDGEWRSGGMRRWVGAAAGIGERDDGG